jgi:Cu/Ag efflux pump CusA
MINKIVDIALGNRAVVLVLIAALVIAGLLSIQRLPFDADPDISPLQVLVTTQAPGLAPPDVERSITTPIELALQGLPGMTSYRSISRYGLSVIYVKFADGGDILTDRALVAQRLSQTALPAGAGTQKKRGPPPTGKGVPILVRIQPPLLRTLDEWIGNQDVSLTRPQAIRRLIKIVLTAKLKPQNTRGEK